jgi:surfeit locus 1 family protein
VSATPIRLNGIAWRFGNRIFRPRLGPTLVTLPMLAVLIGLGTWQVHRLHWKTGLIAARAAALAAPAQVLPVSDVAAVGLDFHPVAVSGRFLNDKELFLGAEDKRGQPGFQVVTPLLLEDGYYLLVNRGFVPPGRRDPATRPAGQISGQVRIEGVLRVVHPPRGWFLPVNRPSDDYWFYVDIPVMAAAARLPLARVLPYVVEVGPAANPGGLPVGGQTDPSLPNNHFEYLVTWYALAVALLVIYVLKHSRRIDEDAPP